MNELSDKIQAELESLREEVKHLKIEENIFNGISSELYAKERQVDNLKYSIIQAELIISNLQELHLDMHKTLEDLKSSLLIFTKT